LEGRREVSHESQVPRSIKKVKKGRGGLISRSRKGENQGEANSDWGGGGSGGRGGGGGGT